MASNYITAVRTSTGDKQIDYEALANKPKKFTTVSVNGNNILSTVENDTLSFTTGKGISLVPDADNRTINIGISDSLVNDMTQDVSSMLISDQVKKLYEMESDATIDEILTFLRHTITTKILNIYVTTDGGIPLENIAVSGDIVDLNGNPVTMYTNENGYLAARVNDGVSSISITAKYDGNWADVNETKTDTYSISDKMIQTINIKMGRNTSMVVNTSSSFEVSPEVSTVRISTSGGGGGGGGTATSYYTYETSSDSNPDYVYTETTTCYAGGGGGGGGYVVDEDVALEEKCNTIYVTIGEGGSAGKPQSCRYDVGDTVETTIRGTTGSAGNATYITIDGVNYAYASGGGGGQGGFATASPYAGGHSGGSGGSGNGEGGKGGHYGGYVSSSSPGVGQPGIQPKGGSTGSSSSSRGSYDCDTGASGGNANTPTLLYGGARIGGGGSGRGYDGNKQVCYSSGGSPYGGSNSSGKGYGGGGAGGYNGYHGVAGFKFDFRN